MNAENFREKINYLLDYKDLMSNYLFEESNEAVSSRDLMDQIECDIDFYLTQTMASGGDTPLLN